jgi:Tol biopolymer transport system component
MVREHRPLRRLAGLALLCLWSLSTMGQKASTYPFSTNGPLDKPRVFGAGIISAGEHELELTLTPDGRTAYFVKASPGWGIMRIVFSQFRDGRWETPQMAEFSGQYKDTDPFITPDGSKLYFVSNRPDTGTTPNKDEDIFVVERTAEGWGAPHRLGPPINTSGGDSFPTVAANGTLYFCSDRAGGFGDGDVYRSRLVNGKYAEPENLGAAINSKSGEWHAYIAPDERFLVFVSDRPGGAGRDDLYISYHRHGQWTKAANMSDLNTPAMDYAPSVSPDGKYLFFTSTRSLPLPPSSGRRLTYKELLEQIRSPGNGLADIYQVELKNYAVGQ